MNESEVKKINTTETKLDRLCQHVKSVCIIGLFPFACQLTLSLMLRVVNLAITE